MRSCIGERALSVGIAVEIGGRLGGVNAWLGCGWGLSVLNVLIAWSAASVRRCGLSRPGGRFACIAGCAAFALAAQRRLSRLPLAWLDRSSR